MDITDKTLTFVKERGNDSITNPSLLILKAGRFEYKQEREFIENMSTTLPIPINSYTE